MRKKPFKNTAPSALSLPKNDLLIINQIASEFQDMSRKNIKSWRQALDTINSENPNWCELQDLISYLMPDGHLGSQIEIRKGAIEASRWYIRSKKTNKEDPEKTELLNRRWFFNVLSEGLNASLFKYTLLQLVNPETFQFKLVPRRNVSPEKRFIRKAVTDTKGWAFDDPAFANTLIYVEGSTDYGIINDIIPDLIWKKNARQAWATFGEKFGIPLMSAQTASRDPKDISRIEAMLRALGSAAQAVLPMGTTLDIKDQVGKGDPYNVFLKQMEYSDAQVSKRLLGGTMISDNGSSKSQSEVHERTMNYIIAEKEKKMMEFMVNDDLLPLLAANGMPFTEDDQFVFDRSQDLTISEHWTIIKDALNYYDIPEEWVSETFSFPILGKKQVQQPQQQQDLPTDTPPGAQAKGGGFFD